MQLSELLEPKNIPCLLKLKPTVSVVKDESIKTPKQKRNSPTHRFFDNDHKRWQRMVDEGKSYMEIARIEDCHPTTIMKHTKPLDKKNHISFGALRKMVSSGEELKEVIVCCNHKPAFKLVPIKQDENNEL